MADFAAAYLVGASLCLPFMWLGWKDCDDSVPSLIMYTIMWPLWVLAVLTDENWE